MRRVVGLWAWRNRARAAAWLAVPALALLWGSAASAEVITNLSVIPNPFSPNGDGVLDRTTISCEVVSDCDSLRLMVHNESNGQSWSLTAVDVAPDFHSWVWAGTTSTGVTFSDSVHSLCALAFVDGAVADSAVRRVTTDTTPPRIDPFSSEPSAFAPDAVLSNVTRVTFGVETGGPALDTTLVRVTNLDDSVVVSLGGFRGARAETTFNWNGTDEDSLAVAEGFYLLQVVAADEAGNRDEDAARVYLDLGAPELLADGEEFHVTAFPETLTGRVWDPAGIGAVLLRAAGGQWEEAEVTGEDTLSWQYVFGDVGDADGWYDLDIRARDVFDHYGDVIAARVGKASRAPVHVSSSIVTWPDTIFANEDEILILSEWDSAGYEIEADFIEIDSKYIEGAENVTDNDDGTYDISYSIRLSNARENATELPIKITVTYVWRIDSVFVWAELRNEEEQPEAPERLALDQNLFNPDNGEVVNIGIPSAAAARTVEIYNLVGERVWTEKIGGRTSIEWSGLNSEGEVVASGVYLVRVAEEIRKVGVVK